VGGPVDEDGRCRRFGVHLAAPTRSPLVGHGCPARQRCASQRSSTMSQLSTSRTPVTSCTSW
jgi:hypothetical protein